MGAKVACHSSRNPLFEEFEDCRPSKVPMSNTEKLPVPAFNSNSDEICSLKRQLSGYKRKCNELETEQKQLTLKATDTNSVQLHSLKCELNEYKQKFTELESENKELKTKLTEKTTDHKHWDYEQCVQWIVNIQDGPFEPYKPSLLANFKNEHIDGTCLHLIDTTDLHRMGIDNFSHKKLLLFHIAELTENDTVTLHKKMGQKYHSYNPSTEPSIAPMLITKLFRSRSSHKIEPKTPKKLSLTQKIEKAERSKSHSPIALPPKAMLFRYTMTKSVTFGADEKIEKVHYSQKISRSFFASTFPKPMASKSCRYILEEHIDNDLDQSNKMQRALSLNSLNPFGADNDCKEWELTKSVQKLLAPSPSKKKQWRYKNGVLSVKVIKATNCPCIDNDESNLRCYAELELNQKYSQTEKTKVIKNNANPVWNELFQLFPEDPLNDTLQCRIWDKKSWPFGNKLGSVTISVFDVLNADGYIKKEYDLKQRGLNSGGKLYVELKYKELKA